MKDEFIEGHMNTQAVRMNGSGFVYRNPLDGKIYESMGEKPLNWDEGYPPGIEPETPEAHDYDAMRAKYQSLPNYAMNREFIDQQIAKPEDSQYEDPLWIGASRILYHYMNHKPARKRHGRNPATEAQDAKPLDSGYSYADWGINFMLKFNYNLPYMMVQANKTRSMPVDVAKAMYYLMETSDRDGISASNTGMGVAHAAWDVTNWIGLATFGIGMAGKQAGKIATKEGIKALLKEIIMANPTKASVATGVEGALFSAADNLAQQGVRINAEQQTGINKGELATSATIGAVVGEEITRVGAPLVRKGGELLKKGLENARDKAQASKDAKEIDNIVDNELGMVKDTSPEMDLDKSVGSGALRENVSFNEIDELGFYSQLLETSKILPPKISTVDAIQILKKKGGVKDEELEWVGINDFLEDQKEKGNKSFDRNELIAFIKSNQVMLEQRRRGGVDVNDSFAEGGRDPIDTVQMNWQDVYDGDNPLDPDFFNSRIDDIIDDRDFEHQSWIAFMKRKFVQEEGLSEIDANLKADSIYKKFLEYKDEDQIPTKEIAFGSTFQGSRGKVNIDSEVQDNYYAYMQQLGREEYENEPWNIIGLVTDENLAGSYTTRPDGYYAVGNDSLGYVIMKGGVRDDHTTETLQNMANGRAMFDEIQVKDYVQEVNRDYGHITEADYIDSGSFDKPTSYGEYTLNGVGDSNYTENTLVIANPKTVLRNTMTSKRDPRLEGAPSYVTNPVYDRSHFGDGEVVHYRSTYRGFEIDGDDIQVLGVEEIQSDWAQRSEYGKATLTEQNVADFEQVKDQIRTFGQENAPIIADNISNDFGLDENVFGNDATSLAKVIVSLSTRQSPPFNADKSMNDLNPVVFFNEIFGRSPSFADGRMRTNFPGDLLQEHFKKLHSQNEIAQGVLQNFEDLKVKLSEHAMQGKFDFQKMYDGFVLRNGLPTYSLDEWSSLPTTARVVNFPIGYKGTALVHLDTDKNARLHADNVILHWRKTGELPEDYSWVNNAGQGNMGEPFTGDKQPFIDQLNQSVTTAEVEWGMNGSKLFNELENAGYKQGLGEGSEAIAKIEYDKVGATLLKQIGLTLYNEMKYKGVDHQIQGRIADFPQYPDAPFIGGGKKFTNLALKRIMVDALDQNLEGIALPSHALLTSIDGIGLQSDKLYDTIIPQNINDIIKGTDAKIVQVPLEKYEDYAASDDVLNNIDVERIMEFNDKTRAKYYFNVIRFTPQLKERIKKGFALFSALPLALTGAELMTNQEGGDNVNTTY